MIQSLEQKQTQSVCINCYFGITCGVRFEHMVILHYSFATLHQAAQYEVILTFFIRRLLPFKSLICIEHRLMCNSIKLGYVYCSNSKIQQLKHDFNQDFNSPNLHLSCCQPTMAINRPMNLKYVRWSGLTSEAGLIWSE